MKSYFVLPEIEYLGYILTREGIKPQPEKCTAILALKRPENIKSLRKFLGMVQYYRDLWEKRSHLIAPLTDLIGECGETKTTKKKKIKKKPFYWSEVHNQAFEAIKKVISRVKSCLLTRITVSRLRYLPMLQLDSQVQ